MATKRVKVYTVVRTTEDPFDVNNDTEIRGTYQSLAEANKAVERDLIDEFGRDFFYSYRVSKTNGRSEVDSVCGEGEEVRV